MHSLPSHCSQRSDPLNNLCFITLAVLIGKLTSLFQLYEVSLASILKDSYISV
jgi:hypothetical protein